jgi:D-hydroxyproline dehydrogenase subunit beta
MSYDVAVAGAGIVGLAHAEQLAKRGLKVAVFERSPKAQGASVRNFGMIWPIGQPLGEMYRLAKSSRDSWRTLLQSFGIWHEPCGSVHLAYHEDEAQVLREFVAQAADAGVPCEMWSPQQTRTRFPLIRPDGLLGAMWSPEEIIVDPRTVVAKLPQRLAGTYGVEFHFGTTILGYDDRTVRTTSGTFRADRLAICTGADYRELAPVSFAQSGLIPCKLQMMRSQPYGNTLRVGTMLAAGLTLRHYKSFANCPTQAALIRRLDAQYPEYARYGIHVMLSQNEAGEMIIGDSHEYGDEIDPFDKPHVDDLILAYLRTFADIPDLQIAARWHGIYIKHPKLPYLVAHPEPNVLAVTGVGGAGMTLSFGLAEQTVGQWLGERG